ncbi:hypothetical protein ACFL3D_01860 [Candidatus Omnitrophota bacterium]
MTAKEIKIWFGIICTIVGVVFGYGQVCKAVERNEQDIQTVAQTQQQLIEKFYTAQMEMNTLIYEHMLKTGGEGDDERVE